MSLMLPNARVLNPAIPPALAFILQKMTSKDVDERYASADEVLQDIIRKFTAPRANVAPSLTRAASPQLVAESPASMPDGPVLPKSHAPVAKPPSLLHLVKAEKSTTTHTVQVDPQGIVARETKSTDEEQTARPRSAGPRPTHPHRQSPPSNGPARAVASVRTRSVSASVRPKGPPKVVPTPAPVAELPKKQRTILLPTAAALLFVASLVVGFSYAWPKYFVRPAQKTVQSIIEEGMSQYRAESYQEARATFLKASVMSDGNPQLTAEANQADTMRLLVDGQLALRRDEFAKVEQSLSEASVRGADVAALSNLRNRFQAKRDALRLSAEGVKAVEAGRFIDAEAKVTDYEESAKMAGLDPESLKNKLYQERENREYEQALDRAREALADNNFDSATLALRDAQVIRNTTATRQLRQDILDAKSRHDWMVRGDKAMKERDFAAAESAYQSANAVDPTDEIEQKLKVASSMRLLNEARDEVRSGNLLNAKKKLENSLWKWNMNKSARAKLVGLTKAFEAAQLVESGDQEFVRGNYDEAIRLYEKAIPDLVAPADEFAKAKLQEARQGKSRASKN
ncbi:MAG: hypothetical protein IPK83_08730 [Planctomycetes bacterium]|nr:hypothetical protein [Planctomycetota bacterium]